MAGCVTIERSASAVHGAKLVIQQVLTEVHLWAMLTLLYHTPNTFKRLYFRLHMFLRVLMDTARDFEPQGPQHSGKNV